MSNAIDAGMIANTLEPTEVHCDACGALPGSPCTTPTGKFTRYPHQDRRANSQVINRHLRYMSKH